MKYKMNYLGLLLTIPTILTQGLIHGQTNDPFSNKPGEKAPKAESIPDSPAEIFLMINDMPKNIEVCYEEFSLPLDQAAALQRRRLTGEGLYQEVLGLTKDGVAVHETLLINYARSGQQTSTKENTEIIHPTETPEPSGSSPNDKDSTDELTIPSTPMPSTVFQSRELGSTFETEAVIGESNLMPLTLKGMKFLQEGSVFEQANDDPFSFSKESNARYEAYIDELSKALKDGDIEQSQLIDISYSIKQVTQESHSIWKNSDSTVSEFPNFQVKEKATSVNLKSGVTSFLGTSTMPTVREPGAALPTKRVWFAFITATSKIVGK